MRKLATLLIACCLPLAACETTSTAIGSLPSTEQAQAVGDKVVLEGARYFLVAQDGYQAAANSTATLIRNGIFKPNEGQKLMLTSLNDNALKLIEGTDKTLTIAQRAAGLITIAGQINSIIGRK